MNAVAALGSRRDRASDVVRAAYATADRRNAEALVLGWLLGACDGADAVATAEYVAGVRQGFRDARRDARRDAQRDAQWRRATLRAFGAEGVQP